MFSARRQLFSILCAIAANKRPEVQRRRSANPVDTHSQAVEHRVGTEQATLAICVWNTGFGNEWARRLTEFGLTTYDANRRAAMPQRPKRETVDLPGYPDLVVVYLGMRVNAIIGFKTMLGFGPKISAAVGANPDGLLLHESFLFSVRHFGMRQYWRDFESLEAWSRSEPHRQWWQEFLRDSGGTG